MATHWRGDTSHTNTKDKSSTRIKASCHTITHSWQQTTAQHRLCHNYVCVYSPLSGNRQTGIVPCSCACIRVPTCMSMYRGNLLDLVWRHIAHQTANTTASHHTANNNGKKVSTPNRTRRHATNVQHMHGWACGDGYLCVLWHTPQHTQITSTYPCTLQCVRVHACVCVCMHARARACMRVRVCACVCVCGFVCVNAHAYA